MNSNPELIDILAHDLPSITEVYFSGGAVVDLAWVSTKSEYASKHIILTDEVYGVVYVAGYAGMYTPINLGDKVSDLAFYDNHGELIQKIDSATGMCYAEKAYYFAIEVPVGHLPLGSVDFLGERPEREEGSQSEAI